MRFDFGLCPHHDTSASGFVGIAHPTYTIYISSRREVGRLDVLHQAVHINIVVVNVSHTGINHFAQVVGRHVGSHTYGDTRCSVHQQVRDTGRHDRRFLQRVIEVVGEVYGFLVKVLHHFLADFLQAGFGVSHGGGTIPVD